MSALSGSDVSLAQGADFPELARALFGSVRLDFPRQDQFRQIRSLTRGDCRFSSLEASEHTVFGDHVVSRSDDSDAIKLLMQSRGRSEMHQAGRRIVVGPGMAVVYDPTRPYTLINPEPVRLEIVQVPRSLLGPSLLRRLERPLTTVLPRTGLVGADWPPNPDAFLRWLQEAIDPYPREPAATLATLRRRAMDFLDRNLHRPELDLLEVARRMGCSTRYLHRAFAAVETTPSGYLWQRRLETACAALLDSADTRPIIDVALDCGYSSSAHFSRAFRSRYGCSPRDMRVSASIPRS